MLNLAIIGSSNAAVATLLVISVRNVITRQMMSNETKGGKCPTPMIAELIKSENFEIVKAFERASPAPKSRMIPQGILAVTVFQSNRVPPDLLGMINSVIPMNIAAVASETYADFSSRL